MTMRILTGRMAGGAAGGAGAAGMGGSAAAIDAANRKAANDAYAQQQYEELQKKADEKSGAEADTCKKCSNREKRCEALREKIQNQVDDINKRYDEVVENECELPFSHKDPAYKKSIMGHYLHYWLEQEKLRSNIAEFYAKGCENLPKGANEAAEKGTPKPKNPPKGWDDGPNKCGY